MYFRRMKGYKHGVGFFGMCNKGGKCPLLEKKEEKGVERRK